MKIREKVRDEDPAPVPGPRMAPSDPESNRIGLLGLLLQFQEANTAFLQVREFLRSRGLTHVSQLDTDGKEALRVYLEVHLERLRSSRP